MCRSLHDTLLYRPFETQRPPKESKVSIHADSEYYVIRESEDGYISVFLSDGSLYQNWNVPAYTLPSGDRERLRIGIMAKSDAELASYKEGFCS